MGLVSDITLQLNPIDSAEHVFHRNAWGFERRGKDEVVLEVEGKWGNLLFFFAWEEHLRCLHISCMMDIETRISDFSKIFELLALVNENLWLGHFSYWSEHRMPLFKHSVILELDERDLESKLEQIIRIAADECDRIYPIFNAVLTQGVSPRQALSASRGVLQ